MPRKESKYLFDRILTADNTFSARWMSLATILLVLLVLITYSGATKNNFVYWDDSEYVINNELVRSDNGNEPGEIFSTVVSLNYHPLTILSLRLNKNSCRDCPDGISARPFIMTNVFLHTLNTILVFILVFFLFRRNILLAFIVAAIFAVHPMHVESVAWVSARKDVLNSFFFLSGLISWYLYLSRGKRKYFWLLLSFVLFLGACLSKATAVVFPLVAILISYLTAGGNNGSSVRSVLSGTLSYGSVLPLLPFFAGSVFFGLMALHIQSGDNFLGMLSFSKEPGDVVNIVAPFSLLQRILIACYGFFVYLIKFLFPVNQSAFYPYPAPEEISHGSFPVLLWTSFIAFIIIVLLVLFSMKKTRIFFFSFGFYLVMLVLVLQFISVGKAIVAERYTYLPYIGLSVIPAYYISRSAGKLRSRLLLLSCLFIMVMLFLAREQVKVWRNAGSLWSQAAKNQPDQELAWRARGKYYYGLSARASGINEKRILENKAMSDFKMAISKHTQSADVYEGMGVILQSRKDFKAALQLLDIAVRLNPANGRTYYNRAIIFDQMKMKEQAIQDYESALTLTPGMVVEILRNRSVLYLETGMYEKALKDLNDLIKFDSPDFNHYYNRAFSKVMLKDYYGAIADYELALKLNPGDKETIGHLKVLYEYKDSK